MSENLCSPLSLQDLDHVVGGKLHGQLRLPTASKHVIKKGCDLAGARFRRLFLRDFVR